MWQWQSNGVELSLLCPLPLMTMSSLSSSLTCKLRICKIISPNRLKFFHKLILRNLLCIMLKLSLSIDIIDKTIPSFIYLQNLIFHNMSFDEIPLMYSELYVIPRQRNLRKTSQVCQCLNNQRMGTSPLSLTYFFADDAAAVTSIMAAEGEDVKGFSRSKW